MSEAVSEPRPDLVGAVRAAIDALRAWVRGRFGARIRELALFGSWARGEAGPDSDVDVLLVVDDLSSEEGREVAHFCGDLLTEHGVLVSVFSLGTARMGELRARERLIAREIDRDRRPL